MVMTKKNIPFLDSDEVRLAILRLQKIKAAVDDSLPVQLIRLICTKTWTLRLIKFSSHKNSSRPIINNFVSLLIGSLKCLKIILQKTNLTDKAHFPLDGIVNKQSCCLWGSENPKFIAESSLGRVRMTCWVDLLVSVYPSARLFLRKLVPQVLRDRRNKNFKRPTFPI